MNKQQYERIHEIVFSGRYPGYRPEVLEVPNGDGKVDAAKRYAHIAKKYHEKADLLTEAERKELLRALFDAHELARNVAIALRLPAEWMPQVELGALRVLEYPVGAVSNAHTDPNLFTCMLYRDQPDRFVFEHVEESLNVQVARHYNEQLHLGEMCEMLGIGKATMHEVVASDTVQHSAVYFAIPSWTSVFPNTTCTVEAFLQERLYGRGRTTVAK